jgi:sigma-B regulation protein RsbU (phosphoserine phosphatase)
MERSNAALCSNNNTNMFVTCWFGILNLTNGELKYTNAGHTDPLLIHNNNVKEFKTKHGLVLGAIDEAKYKENKIVLEPGDKIILYTDGVTEAHNPNNELFGEKGLIEFTKKNITNNAKDYIHNLREEIKKFAGGNEQFDDITMLVVEYQKGAQLMESKIFKADVKELDSLFEYSSTLLEVLDFSKRDIIMINTALEEVFVNVAKYAYEKGGEVEVTLSNDKNKVTFVFRDSGKPFNPLEKEDPNITASSEEREVGGLGIYMVKNIMDETTYEYKDHHNVLTLVKYRKK